MNGNEISVSSSVESSHLAASAASLMRCMAIMSSERSRPVSRWNSCSRNSMMRASKSSPPRKVSPAVDLTS
jgi:hypothetical protein